MGITQCQRAVNPKSHLYLCKMLTSINNSVQCTNHPTDNKFLLLIQSMPTHIMDLLISLNCSSSKFVDELFPCDGIRLSQFIQYPNKYYSSTTSKFITIMQEVIKHYPNIITQPIYISTIGIAKDVIIDDYITNLYEIPNNPCLLLLEKAFAKVLGSYEYINQFNALEIIQQVTGVPISTNHELRIKLTKKHPNTWIQAKINSEMLLDFKDVATDQLIYYQSIKQNITVGYRSDYYISSIPIELPHTYTFYKFQLTSTTILSLKLSQLNHKYYQYQKYTPYHKIFIQLYYRSSHTRQYQQHPLAAPYQSNNHTYIQNVFTSLEEGQYIIYMRSFQQLKNLSLVAYSNHKIKFKHIQPNNKIYALTVGTNILSHNVLSANYVEQQKLYISPGIICRLYQIKQRYIIWFNSIKQHSNLHMSVYINHSNFLFEQINSRQLQLDIQNGFSHITSIIQYSQKYILKLDDFKIQLK